MPGGEQFDFGSTGHQSFAVGQQIPDMVGVRGHGRYADQRAAMQVEMTGFSRGDFEFAPQLRHDGADHGTLFLQRVDVAEQQVQLE